jgi:hypothetical protein
VNHRNSFATALLGCVTLAVLSGGCAAASVSTPSAAQSPPSASAPPATASPGAGSTPPAPSATVTAGPVPAAAVQAAARYWRLINAHRNAALLQVVTADSQAAAALRAGRGTTFWGIKRVGVVSTNATVAPTPPAGATIEFSMMVDIVPRRGSAWIAGHNVVFMSLRRVGGTWLVYESGSGP